MRGLLTLGVAALGLGGVIALELTDIAVPLDAPLPAVAVPPAAKPRQAAAGPRTPETAQATLLRRPLFSPSRRPPPPSPAAVAAMDPRRPPRLAGVLVAPFGRRAIFAKGIVVAEGGALGPYTVRTIRPGQVTIVGPGGAQVLHPAFAAASQPAAPPPDRPLRPTPPALTAPK